MIVGRLNERDGGVRRAVSDWELAPSLTVGFLID